MSCISVFIVDDVAIERGGIKKLIESYQQDCVIELFENGQAAIERIRHGCIPDLIITDIRMPIMDGLELSRQVLSEWPFVKIIVVSAYDEFAYAQQALKIGVYDYILKPIDVFDFGRIFEKAYQAALSEKEEKYNHFRENLMQYVFYRKRFTAQEQMLPWQGDVLPILVCLGSRSDQCLPIECSGIFPAQYSSYHLDDYTDLLLLHEFSAPVPDRSQSTAMLDALTRRLTEAAQRVCIVLCGGYVRSMLDLTHELDKMDRMLDRMMDISQSAFFFVDDPAHLDGKGHSDTLLPHLAAATLASSDVLNAETVRVELNNVLEKLRSIPGLSQRQVRRHVAMALEIVGSRFPLNPDTAPSLNDLRNCQTLEQLSDFLQSYCTALSKLSASNERSSVDSRIVSQITQYIDEHFAEDINLQSIADALHYSPGYISTIFRRVTGDSVIKAINRRRIAAAKNLLLTTNHTSAEISQMVGYTSSSYFGQIFRLTTGLTPNSFRETCSALST